MSTRLAVTLAIPVAGLLLLLAALAAVAEEETIRFRGATYVAGAVVVQPGAATPTRERVASRQVWLPPRDGAEYDLYLQLADGRFRGYRRRP